ncbi:apolipoprotein N-acyltransferase [Inquilinus sp. Marseille-Q2685]|uniref:apolipoprotein N-acyltransferase n=1 Tax=Inquilinus sp. Marseille-Q2685 TaxID=2866581 RepID=UPI001CE3C05D|nr:apolipoprotein N-acyltransferase [Inquilinus sp. Marseille-Q2685]
MPIRAGSNASASAAATAPRLAETAGPQPGGILDRIAARLMGLSRWRRFGTAIGLGVLASLSVPPLYAAPALWLAFPGLFWLLAGARGGWSAFLTGWAFGFGFFVPGLYWVSWALTVDLPRFFWMIPFALAGLPALLGIFTGLAGLGFHGLRRAGWGGPLALAAAWGLAEWLRGHVLTGFPWNLIGYTWVGWLPVLQGVSVIGIYGLSALTVAAATLPATLAGPRQGWAATAAGIALFLAIGAWGAGRLSGDDGATVPGVTLRLVQPNISQADKWSGDKLVENFNKQLAMSTGPGIERVSAVIWSETAVPFTLSWEPEAQKALGAILPPSALALVGATRATPYGTQPLQAWNSIYALDRSGTILATYDKAHLVPFGEYVPFHAFLKQFGIEKITAGSLDFSAGPGPRTIDLPGLPPVSPLICYEAIFPGAVLDPAGPRPGWLLNVTNDGWYGLTSGPHQHFAIARTRAVEEGLPLVRAANTGISGVVDAYGRVTGEIALGTAGILDTPLPAALPETPYARWGEAGFWLLLVLGLLAGRIGRPARPIPPPSAAGLP